MKYIRLLRIKHYIKNFLVFLPIIFGGHIFDIQLTKHVVWGMLAFSMLSSVIYILNDIKDVDKDRKHPKKKERPIASGEINIKKAYAFGSLLFICSIITNLIATYGLENKIYVWIIFGGYFGINLVYSVLGGKNIPLLDVVLLASGYVIRVYYGSAISGIDVSVWMSLVVLSGSFYMGFGKRRNELMKTADMTRDVLRYYNKEFLNNAMNCCMTLTIVFYALWGLVQVQNNESIMYIWSIPLLMILIFKYSMDVEKFDNAGSGDPIEVIQSDKILMLLVLGIGVYMGVCLYAI